MSAASDRLFAQRPRVADRIRRIDPVVTAVVGVVVLVALPGLYRLAGPPMEEGYMLVFPERVLAGDRPHVDFLHLYGPGALWTLAAVYRFLGATLSVERTVGLLQHLALISAVTVIARRWGRSPAVAAGITATLLALTANGLVAMAWTGAVALVLWAAIVALGQLDSSAPSPARLGLGGVLAGLALLYRPDLAVAVAAATAVVLWRAWARPGCRRALGAGFVVGVAPFLVLLGQVGVGHAVTGMLVDPVARLRPGRRLPVPPSWSSLDGALQKGGALRAWRPLPALAQPHQVFLWFWLMIAVAVGVAAVAWWSHRRDRASGVEPSGRTWLLLAVGAIGLGLLPQALQRPDTTHLAWVGCVPFAIAPAAIAELLDRRARRSDRVVGRGLTVAAAAAVPIALCVVAPSFTSFTYVDTVAQGYGWRDEGRPVRRGDRSFRLGSDDQARQAASLIEVLDPLVARGQRLFVGTADLSRTPYADAFFYHLYPELQPATFHIDMNPGLANDPARGLDADVASADWLILSRWWDAWSEPNTSMDPGSDAANRVVREQFCQVASIEDRLLLYRRCGP